MTKIHLFTQDHLMVLQKYMVFGLQKTIEKPIICLHVMVFCLTMKVPRRGETFVTRKITRATARIALGITRQTIFRKFRC